MSTADYELRYLEAGLETLEKFLLSKDIYRPIGIKEKQGEPPYPPLSLGWLLLYLYRAQSSNLSGAQFVDLETIRIKIGKFRNNWHSAWRQKAQSEFHSRLSLWRDYLEEYRENPGGNKDRYSYEVTRRVMLQLLNSEADQLPEAEIQALDELDKILLQILKPGEFIWNPHWKESFPKADFWYLYGSPGSIQAVEREN